MKKFLRLASFSLGGLVLALPLIAFAQPSDIKGILGIAASLLNLSARVLAGLALLVFFFGLAKFILNAASEEAQREGKQFMIWGIIALFVMVSVWGLVAVLQNTFFSGQATCDVNPSTFGCFGP
jgi:TM2 domain-containing membrane protein YozV